MEFNKEELDRQILDRLAGYGVFISKTAPPLNNKKALVLLGEAMLERFVKDFVSLWKSELFSDCQLQDFEASAEEVHEWVHGGDPQLECKLCSNDCKEVDGKMGQNTQAKLNSYLELFEEIKQKTGDDKIALGLLAEMSKDRRMEEIREEREMKNRQPATIKQRKFMDDLGIKYPKNVTKQEASVLIDEELGKNGE